MSNPAIQKNQWDDLCHQLLNGLVAIKGMIRQYEVGMLPADEMKNKIESRCRSMEKEIFNCRSNKK